jgi:shikimate dehydrogenase
MSTDIILDPRQYPDLNVYGVIGNPIEHSLSPKIHEQFAKQTQQAIHYGKLFSELGAFKETVDLFFARGGKGLNVTVPFKSQAFELCMHLTQRAQAAGVVNILWQVEGVYFGDNSDGIGLVRDIENAGYPFAQQRVLLIGAGGAVQGVVLPILQMKPKSIVIVNRTLDKAKAIVERFMEHANVLDIELQAISTEQLLEDEGGFDRMINGTSAGLNDASPLSAELIEKLASSSEPQAALAYDMVYGKETAFLKQMKQTGFNVQDGLGMLVEQAAVSFELWRQLPENLLNTQEVLAVLRTT